MDATDVIGAMTCGVGFCYGFFEKIFGGLAYIAVALSVADAGLDFAYVAEIHKNQETTGHAAWLAICTTIPLILRLYLKWCATEGSDIYKDKLVFITACSFSELGTFFTEDTTTLYIWWQTGLYFDTGAQVAAAAQAAAVSHAFDNCTALSASAEICITCRSMLVLKPYEWTMNTPAYFTNICMPLTGENVTTIEGGPSILSQANLITTVISALLALCAMVYSFCRFLKDGINSHHNMTDMIIITTPAIAGLGVVIFWVWFALDIILDGDSYGCKGECQGVSLATRRSEFPTRTEVLQNTFRGTLSTDEGDNLNKAVAGFYVVGWIFGLYCLFAGAGYG